MCLHRRNLDPVPFEDRNLYCTNGLPHIRHHFANASWTWMNYFPFSATDVAVPVGNRQIVTVFTFFGSIITSLSILSTRSSESGMSSILIFSLFPALLFPYSPYSNSCTYYIVSKIHHSITKHYFHYPKLICRLLVCLVYATFTSSNDWNLILTYLIQALRLSVNDFSPHI